MSLKYPINCHSCIQKMWLFVLIKIDFGWFWYLFFMGYMFYQVHTPRPMVAYQQHADVVQIAIRQWRCLRFISIVSIDIKYRKRQWRCSIIIQLLSMNAGMKKHVYLAQWIKCWIRYSYIPRNLIMLFPLKTIPSSNIRNVMFPLSNIPSPNE